MYYRRQNYYPQINPSWILFLVAAGINASGPDQDDPKENEEDKNFQGYTLKIR